MVDKTLVPEGTILEERFKILREIGRGGMGAVYVGEHAITGKRLAIKVMGEAISSDTAYKQRFLREAKLMAQMDDPHIASVSAVGAWNDRLYLVMDYVEGRTLQAELRERGENKMDEARVCAIASQVCDALGHAHKIGVVHRDLKPGNVMLTDTASGVSVKLLDFGIAAWLDRDEAGRITQTGEVFGSPYYMSPEQCQGMRLDGRSDLYSLGCIMYEMLSGQTPFSGDSYFEVLSKQMAADPPPIEGISAGMQQVVNRAMTKNPDHRYPDAAALNEDLRKVMAGETVSIERSGKKQSRSAGTARTTGKRRRVITLIAVPVLLAGLAIAAHYFLQAPVVEPPSAPVVKVSDSESELAEAMEGSGEVASMKFCGLLPEPRLPLHRKAMDIMDARVTLPLGDPERIAFLVEATRLLRDELNSPDMANAGSEERNLMLHRLAFWDALLISHQPRSRRSALYREGDEAITKSVEYDKMLGLKGKVRRTEILAYLSLQYGREMRDLPALERSEKFYVEVINLLKERERTADESEVFQRCLSRLEEVRDRILNTNKLVNLQNFIKDPKEDEIGHFERAMFAVGGKLMRWRELEPRHRRAAFLFSQYRSAVRSPQQKEADLSDAREFLRKLIESAEHGDFSPPLKDEELALIHLRRGICDIELAGLVEDSGRREKYYRQAERDVNNSIDTYRKVVPDYRDSFEARWRLGYVHYKYALFSNDRHAYEQARSDFVFALNKLQEMGKKRPISSDEQRLADRLEKAVELIDKRIGKDGSLFH